MEKTQKISLVTRAVYEGIFKKLENEVIATNTWTQVTTPMARTPFKNAVYNSVMSEESASQRIEETIAHYQSRNLPFRWLISPHSEPGNLSEKLVSRGFKLNDQLEGLYAEPGNLNIEVHPEVKVSLVTLENLEDWMSVQEHAWKIPEPGLRFMRAEMQQVLSNSERRSNDYIAYLHGQPVGAGRVSFYRDYAFLTGAAVRPEARLKGVYRTLLDARVREIQARGVNSIVIHCLKDTSAPICMKLGFEKVCEIQSYHFGE
jgi:GNAT superfamily N-acetyltransferase